MLTNKRKAAIEANYFKRTRNDVLNIITDISYIVEYELMSNNKNELDLEEIKSRKDEISKMFLDALDISMKDYLNIRERIIKLAGEIDSQVNTIYDIGFPWEINNIITFIAALFRYPKGIHVYLNHEEAGNPWLKRKGEKWKIKADITIYGDDGVGIIYKGQDTYPRNGEWYSTCVNITNNDYILFASRILEIYNLYYDENNCIRIDTIRGTGLKDQEAAMSHLMDIIKRKQDKE